MRDSTKKLNETSKRLEEKPIDDATTEDRDDLIAAREAMKEEGSISLEELI